MRRSGLYFVTLCAALILTLPFQAQADDLPTRVTTLLNIFRTQYSFPGATAAYALPGGTVRTVAVGLSDVEAKTPMTPESRMLAASIGKSFVAATVLALETNGVLSQADLVSRYLGTRDWFDRLPNHQTMTIGHLLRHSAGLSDHVHTDAFAAEIKARIQKNADALSPEAAISLVLDSDPLFPAGTGWAYTDTGYLLLGLVIEQVAARYYYDLVAERFLTPLGLDATTPSNQRALPGLAVGYTEPDNPFGIPARTLDEQSKLAWDPAMEWTGGGPVYGHGGWIPGYVSSLRHYADANVTIAFQINADVGIVDDSSDLVPALEAALADLVINGITR